MPDLERAKNAMCDVGRALLNDAAMAADRFGLAGLHIVRVQATKALADHTNACETCLRAVVGLGFEIRIDQATGRGR